MPRYSALTRLRYALLDLWTVLRGAVTPLQQPIAPQPMPRPDPRRCVVMGEIEGYEPHGFSDLLWGYYDDGGDEWERVRVPATDCPRIPASFLAGEARTMPQRWYDSEYNCLFVDVEGAVFRYDDLLLALSSDVEPLKLGGNRA